MISKSIFYICSVLLSCQFIAGQATPGNPLGPLPEQRSLSPSGDRSKQFTYYQTGEANAEHIIIAIHGITREAEATCRQFRTAREMARRGPNGSLILCPLFETTESANSNGGNNNNRVTWATPISYSNLDPAMNAAEVNAITIVEDLLERSVSAQTRTITIAGFAEGGDLVQRLALFADFPELLPRIPVRFMMLSPGTFVYPSAHRLSPQILYQMNERTDPFLINQVQPNMYTQEGLPGCRMSYNQYGYGLGMNRTLPPSHFALRYLTDQSGNRAALERFSTRQMLLISDLSDTSVTGSLDRSCEANSQGPNRIWRSLLYHRLLSFLNVRLPFLVVQQNPCGHQVGCLLRNDTVQALVFDPSSLAFSGRW